MLVIGSRRKCGKNKTHKKKKTLHLDSSDVSDYLDDLEQADEEEEEYGGAQADGTPPIISKLNRGTMGSIPGTH